MSGFGLLFHNDCLVCVYYSDLNISFSDLKLRKPRLKLFIVCSEMCGDTELQEIDLGHNNLNMVDTDILARGVTNIQVVKLYKTNLTRQQIERIIRVTTGKLKSLDICFNAAIREVPRPTLQLAEQKILEFSYLMH